MLISEIINYTQPNHTKDEELDAEDIPLSEITTELFIGNVYAAGKPQQRLPNYEEKAQVLKDRGITHIVCCTEDARHYLEGNFTYHDVTLTDTDDAEITPHLKSTIKFIEDALESNGKVLVHCGAGVSRSASVVIAYLMHQGVDYQSAFNYVKTKRPCINPNRGFARQLQSYKTT